MLITVPLQMLHHLAHVFYTNCHALLSDEQLLEQLAAENFDLGITEWFDVCGLGVFRRIGLRKFISASGQAVQPQLAGVLGIPPMTSFVPGELYVVPHSSEKHPQQLLYYATSYSRPLPEFQAFSARAGGATACSAGLPVC